MAWELWLTLWGLIVGLVLFLAWVARLQGAAQARRDDAQAHVDALQDANQALARPRRLGRRLRARLREDPP